MSRRGRKKRPARPAGERDVEAWQAWLVGEGEPPGAVSAEAESARGLFTDDTTAIPAVTGALAVALARTLRSAPESLVRCVEQGGRDLAKAARRELHDLRRRGEAVPTIERPAMATPEASPGAYQIDASWGLLTTPFNDGDQLLAFRCRASTESKLTVGLAALSDTSGLPELDLYQGNARLFRETAARCTEQVPGAEISFARCLFLLGRAAVLSKDKGRPLPQGFRDLQHVLRTDWPQEDDHPARAIPVADAVTPDQQAALWELPEIAHWVPPRVLWPEIERRFQEVAQSKLYLDPAQRQEQLARVTRWAAQECFARERRPAWAERLADAAWVATAHRHLAEASHLMALRRQILDDDFDPAELDFCRFLVIRPGQEPLRPPGDPGEPAQPDTTDSASLLWTPGQPDPGRGGTGQDPQGGGGLIVPGR